jgi:hypothetical protein
MTPKKMGRPPTGKPRYYVRLPEFIWREVERLAAENSRTRDLQIEAMLKQFIPKEGPGAAAAEEFERGEIIRRSAKPFRGVPK